MAEVLLNQTQTQTQTPEAFGAAVVVSPGMAVALADGGARPRLVLALRSGLTMWGRAVTVTEALRRLHIPTAVLEAQQILSGGGLTHVAGDGLLGGRLHLVDVIEISDTALSARAVAFVSCEDVRSCALVTDRLGGLLRHRTD